MKDNYLDRLVLPLNMRGGYCELNEEIRGRVVEDVIEISFSSLYPNLLLYLYDNGILDKFDIKVTDDIITKLTKIYRDGTQSQNKLWINSLWTRELRPITFRMFELFYQYMSMFYADIIANIPYNWLYIDTDVMFIVGDNELFRKMMKDVPFLVCGCRVDVRPFVFFEAKKKYVIADSALLLKEKGFSSRNTLRKEEIVSIMKTHIRNRKLDDILC